MRRTLCCGIVLVALLTAACSTSHHHTGSEVFNTRQPYRAAVRFPWRAGVQVNQVADFLWAAISPGELPRYSVLYGLDPNGRILKVLYPLTMHAAARTRVEAAIRRSGLFDDPLPLAPIVPAEVGERARQWRRNRVKSYQFVYETSNMCGIARIAVVDQRGKLAGATLLSNGGCGEFDLHHAPTIDSVFAQLVMAYRYGNEVTAKYDTTYGFPTQFDAGLLGVSDSGYSVGVTGFHVLR